MRKAGVLASLAVGVVAAALLPLGAASAAGASGAAKVRCGDTITTSIVLTKNLSCPGDGLTAGADGLTINLNGHTLTGSGVATGITGHAGLTVTNGTVRGFDVGVRGEADARAVRFTANRVGMLLNVHGGTVTDSRFDLNDTGLMHGIGLLTVSGSTFRGNRTGMSCGDADLAVTENRFVDNGTGIYGSVCGARIRDNTFVGGDVAVRLNSQGYVMDVRNNSFTRSGIGISLSGIGDATHSIVGNVFRNNGASGLVIHVADAVRYPVLVAQNTFRGNGFSPGTNVDPTGAPLTSGIWANAGTFTNNTSNANAGHGIEGLGVVDGHGNTARSNRAEPQCVGLACTHR